MKYQVEKSIDIDFAHHVSGHMGHCINIHGHTWKFLVRLGIDNLSPIGFVEDFKVVKQKVLMPVFELLDHSLALSQERFEESAEALGTLGMNLLNTRKETWNVEDIVKNNKLQGAYNVWPSYMKVAVFPFNPTSERLAEWLYGAAQNRLPGITVEHTAVYEALVPVQSVAYYYPEK